MPEVLVEPRASNKRTLRRGMRLVHSPEMLQEVMEGVNGKPAGDHVARTLDTNLAPSSGWPSGVACPAPRSD